MTKICEKHKSEPAIIYGECVGCEIDRLQAEVERLRDALAYGKTLGMEHDAEVIERLKTEMMAYVAKLNMQPGVEFAVDFMDDKIDQLRQQAKEV